MQNTAQNILNYLRDCNESYQEADLPNWLEQQPDLDTIQRKRLFAEFNTWGPIEDLMQTDGITEILINAPNSIWYENHQGLNPHTDCFFTLITYENFVERICSLAHVQLQDEYPIAFGHLQGFRLQIIGKQITGTHPIISLRRQTPSSWDLDQLQNRNMIEDEQRKILNSWISTKKTMLVVGSTGSGKTTLLNACLKELAPNERCVLIEDTQELHLPNAASIRMLTRSAHGAAHPAIEQTDLVKQALRLRPDRIIMGEVRGSEAKDLLMALSTGHAGSFCTLHADNAQQALFRLEMLIQMGAPYWSLYCIRQLIFLSLQGVLVVKKDQDGNRRLDSLYEISGFEETGLLLQKVF